MSGTEAEKNNIRVPSVTDVYIAALPKNAVVGELYCRERMDEIDAVTSERLKLEKYYVWKLLCLALEQSFGMRRDELSFKREAHGAWSVEGAEISLSHSDGVLAVAVSSAPVGIDIERIHVPSSERFAESIMNESELSSFLSAPEKDKERRLIEIWTAKEAIFKSKKSSIFSPKKIDSLSGGYISGCMEIADVKFAWSVAAEDLANVRVFSCIDLAKCN